MDVSQDDGLAGQNGNSLNLVTHECFGGGLFRNRNATWEAPLRKDRET